MATGSIPTRSSNRRIDWKLAAVLRATGLTYPQVAERVQAVSGEAVRQGLIRRGVVGAVRTTLLTAADATARDALAHQSQETRETLSRTVLAHSQALEKVKVKANAKAIKALGAALEPLARTAKVVHGWGEASKAPLVNLNVLGSVQVEELACGDLPPMGSVPESCGVSETIQETKALSDKPNQ